MENSQEGNLLMVTIYKELPLGSGNLWDPNRWRLGEHLKNITIHLLYTYILPYLPLAVRELE